MSSDNEFDKSSRATDELYAIIQPQLEEAKQHCYKQSPLPSGCPTILALSALFRLPKGLKEVVLDDLDDATLRLKAVSRAMEIAHRRGGSTPEDEDY
jgi:hypothetical protein